MGAVGAQAPCVNFHPATAVDAHAVGQAQASLRRRILRAFVGRGLMECFEAKEMLGYKHSGFSVDTSVCITAHDRAGLERLLRYCARPPFAMPGIAQGDKRVLLIGGKPVPFCLARIPQGGEVRGNLAAGGKGVAQPISARDREIAEALGPILAARGLMLVGLDIIGDSLTEINVTSPTCFQEITDQMGCDVAALFIDALEAAL